MNLQIELKSGFNLQAFATIAVPTPPLVSISSSNISLPVPLPVPVLVLVPAVLELCFFSLRLVITGDFVTPTALPVLLPLLAAAVTVFFG